MNTTAAMVLPASRNLPAISEHKLLRYFYFIALYFAQGVPEGMITIGIPAWMAMNGKTPGEIAAFAIVAVLPWSFKFVVAPLMDRYTFLSMGRKRPWILVGQLRLVISCIYMAYIADPLSNLLQLKIAAFIISFFGAFQDVATDGMAVDIIPEEQQAKANGFMWGSKLCGMSVSLAAGSWLLNNYSFQSAIMMLAVVVGIIMLVPVFLKERPGEKLMPWMEGKASAEAQINQLGNWRDLLKSLYRVSVLKHSLLITVLLFICQGSCKYISTLLPIFAVKELGWTNLLYAQNYASAKLIGGILGMLLGGMLINKFGKKRMLNIYFLMFIIVISIFSFSNIYWANKSFVFAFMIAQNTIYTLACIGLFAIAMQCCWKKVSASQFTLYMTISNLGQMVFAACLAPIKAHFNWQYSLFAFACMIAVALLILQFLNIEKHLEKVAGISKGN